MKSLNKKSVTGRGLGKGSRIYCFMFAMIFVSTMLARGEPAKVAFPSEFKDFYWGNRDNFFKFLKQGSESKDSFLVYQ